MSAAVPTRTPLAIHSFTLVFGGRFEDLSEELVDALYEAGCDDGLIGTCDGVLHIHFGREAPSFRVALASAIADVEKAGFGLELVRVEMDDD